MNEESELYDNPADFPADNPSPNPMIMGLDLEAATGVAVGAWAAMNLAEVGARYFPQGVTALDRFRLGLGTSVYQAIAAIVAGRVIGMAKADWMDVVMLGGGAIAVSNLLNSLTGQINLIGGTPTFSALGGRLAAAATRRK